MKAQTKQPKRKRESKRDIYRAPSLEFLATMVVKGWRVTRHEVAHDDGNRARNRTSSTKERSLLTF